MFIEKFLERLSVFRFSISVLEFIIKLYKKSIHYFYLYRFALLITFYFLLIVNIFLTYDSLINVVKQFCYLHSLNCVNSFDKLFCLLGKNNIFEIHI